MSFKFSKRMENIKASEIRELLLLTQQPEIISFAGGLPAPELFPIEAIRDANDKVLKNQGEAALQYGPTDGYLPLREQTLIRMKKLQIDVPVEDVIITSGSQQALDFIARIFINPGDVIITESPSYLGAINAFNSYEPKYVEIDMDEEGMKTDELEEALKSNDNVKFIYVIPDFQNPSGRTMSLERRKKMIELANKYDVVILEDNPYGELRFEGEILPAIKHFDTEGRVIFMGSFSKIYCPGYRIGWVAADSEIIEKINLIKQGSDLQTSTISQMGVTQYMEDNDIEEHISKIIEVYRHRRDLMLDTMKEYFPEEVEFTYPEGGLFTWVTLPEGIDARELAPKALEKFVAYVPGGAFYPNGGGENTLRMNYSCSTDEQIVQGVKALAEVFKEAIENLD